MRRLCTAGHGVFLTAAQLPNGWTETFDAGRVSATDLQEAIRNEHQAVELPAQPLTLF